MFSLAAVMANDDFNSAGHLNPSVTNAVSLIVDF
jgi:hypothetical protein